MSQESRKRPFFQQELDDVEMQEASSLRSAKEPRLETPSPPTCLSPDMANKVAILQDLVGEDVPESKLVSLLKVCRGDMERAANMFYATADVTTSAANSSSSSSSKSKYPDKLYIGYIYIEGWSTITGASPVKEGDPIVIARQRPNLEFYTRRKRKGENIIVRFTTTSGREIGRLKSDSARMISLLLDLGVCDFEATVIDCLPQLSTGKDIQIAVKCFFNKSAFRPIVPTLTESRSRGFQTTAETEEDWVAEQRTLAILDLIRRLNLKATRSAVQRMNLSLTDEEELDDKYKMFKNSITTSISRVREDDPDEENSIQEHEYTLSNEQLDTIYDKARQFDQQIAELDAPPELALVLKPYQKRALAWMLQKESLDQNSGDIDMRSMHPQWEEYAFPEDFDQPSNKSGPPFFYFNPYTGELSLDFPALSTKERGGILADEMGLGKTIEILSLIHKNRYRCGVTPLPADLPENASPTTLIVCPLTLHAQWREEILRGSEPGTIKVQSFYGRERDTFSRGRICAWDGSAPDVLITTYDTIISDFNSPNSALRDIHFWRVVLDEAHLIKNRTSKRAQFCAALKATRRWAVTGTPIQNKLEDLFSLVKFLRHEPWASYKFWRTFITIPFEKQDMRALEAVKAVLEPLVLRRTKDMRDANGQSIVALPPKEVKIEYLDFSRSEQDLYDSLYNYSKNTFSGLCASGKALSNITSILSLLTKLRQAACHPSLVLPKNDKIRYPTSSNSGPVSFDSLSPKDKYGEAIIEALRALQSGASIADDSEHPIAAECPLCFEPTTSKIVMPCMHMVCRSCIMQYLQLQEEQGEQGHCPTCRQPINEEELLEISEKLAEGDNSDDDNPSTSSPRIDVRRAIKAYESSTKVSALMEYLKRYVKERHKSIVFSQFTSFLDIIQIALREEGINHLRLDGSIRGADREKVISEFASKHGQTFVLLVSLRAGGVGLNLTMANKVFIMDPWWNHAVESQAVDRVHRLGQEKPVEVIRFVVRKTVEERILQIQDKKQNLTTQFYMSKEEARTERMRDLKILFGEQA